MPVSLTLPDGKIKSFENTPTGAELAASIGAGLAKAALAVKLDGVVYDLHRPIPRDARVEIITRSSADALELIRHDCAHVMAEAVQSLFPGTQVTIGPAIENGFYYDFYREQPFSTDDLSAIEARMHEIIARNAPLVREEWPRDEAIRFFTEKGEAFKAELIRDLPATEIISIYRQGEWLDLCRGPHLPATGHVGKGFKLLKVAGAYWRGDHRNPMLQRIYGTAWRDEKELQTYLTQLQEAEKRDHRKLGRELNLFHFQDEAMGSVFWHPRGWTLYRVLENYVRRQITRHGYVEVQTPQLFDSSVFKASGHWDMFGDNMFKAHGETVAEIETRLNDPATAAAGPLRELGLKPMNCPGHVLLFNQGIKSYRDLPLRIAEFTNLHRNEAHGALHGLLRVRQMAQDDAHIFCTEDQIQAESIAFCQLLQTTYQDLGFSVARIRLADRPARRGGTEAVWDKAEQALHQAMQSLGQSYDINSGDGAFYGPKLEFYLRDAIGREWQCGTLQCDFVLPESLDAHYIGEDGQKHRPVMLHRAILGSLHRFIGVLIEHYAGKLPLWLAPEQIAVCTITREADDYAKQVYDDLQAAGLRTVLDLSGEKINAKIRDHSLQKIPVIMVVGAKEAAARSVALRHLGGEQQQILPLDEAVTMLAAEALPPDLRS
jgi:threonyl-tRNA synthetase